MGFVLLSLGIVYCVISRLGQGFGLGKAGDKSNETNTFSSTIMEESKKPLALSTRKADG